MNHASPYQLAIFDFDGTLADTMPWFYSMLNQLAQRHRFRQVSPEQIEALRHQTSRQIIHTLGISRWRLPFIARDLSRRSAQAAAAGTFTLFPGIPQLLASLSAAGITLAIVSSNRETTIRHVLGPSAAHIRHFGCSASLFGKARHLRKLLRHTRLHPQAALSVGDEVRDIEAARTVHIPTAAVTWGYAHATTLRAAQPTTICHTLEDLHQLLLPPQVPK